MKLDLRGARGFFSALSCHDVFCEIDEPMQRFHKVREHYARCHQGFIR